MNVRKVLQEAQVRWLKPPEVCQIIENYHDHNFTLSTSPPNKPASGSLFLFDRKVQRYFRKDGHNWRKKRDNRTVREAHERLKSGSVDVLHCYYAHGENDSKFQRRCYWMLDQALEHIVLVHYRQVQEVSKFALRVMEVPVDAAAQGPNASPLLSPDTSAGSGDKEVDDAELDDSVDTETDLAVEPTDQPSLGQQLGDWVKVNLSHQSGGWAAVPSLQYDHLQDASTGYPPTSGYSFTHVAKFMLNDHPDMDPLSSPIDLSSWQNILQNDSMHDNSGSVKKEAEFFVQHGMYGGRQTATSDQMDISVSESGRFPLPGVTSTKPFVQESKAAALCNTYPELNSNISEPSGSSWHSWGSHNRIEPYKVNTEPYAFTVPELAESETEMFSSNQQSSTIVSIPGEVSGAESDTSSALVGHHSKYTGCVTPSKNQGFKKMDSFNRWVVSNLCEDGDDSLVSPQAHSGPEWPASNLVDNTNSEFSREMLVEISSVVSEQKFKIIDFSPEWSFSSTETKVLISGEFLDTTEGPSDCKWAVMFGEVEVPAVCLSTGVLSCSTPVVDPGRVAFYVTRSDRQACSQLREFEFRKNPVPSSKEMDVMVNDLRLQARLARMLLGRCKRSYVSSTGSISSVNKKPFGELIPQSEFAELQSTLEGPDPRPQKAKDLLCEIYLKQLMQDWLLAEMSENGKGICFLDEEGQGVLHIVAALGYSWGINPVLAAGFGIHFRDAHGWTALHWAAAHGRDCAGLLVASGASPALKTDPTPKQPTGLTAADLAHVNGYTGLAAYLAEAALCFRLSSMTIGAKKSDDGASVLKPPKLDIPSLHSGSEEMFLLESSVTAVKKATEAAAAIQAINRQKSIVRHQKLAEQRNENWQVFNEQFREMYAAKVIQQAFRGHHRKQKLHNQKLQNQKLHTAATLIQRRFRGYKGRKAFLNIRSKVVRIQANYRGHLVRKHYRKIIWSVGILEKAVLRWHRKRNGFRGFNFNNEDSGHEDFQRTLKDRFNEEIWEDVEKVRNIVNNVPACKTYTHIKNLEIQELSNQAQHIGQDMNMSV